MTLAKLFQRFMHSTLREKCPYLELLVRVFPHSDQNNSEYGHFVRSAIFSINCLKLLAAEHIYYMAADFQTRFLD